ncbi:GGDEF domain-containing protein [Deinococcus depolymerans]
MSSPAPFDAGSVQLPANLPEPLVRQLRAASNDRERSQALIDLARHLRDTSMHGAQQVGEAALELALQADAPAEAILALIGLSFVAAHLNQLERSSDAVTRAQELIREHDLRDLQAPLLNVRALTHMLIGDLISAQQDLQESLELARQQRDPLDTGNALVNLAWLANNRDEPGEALHHLNLLEEHVHALRDPELRSDLNNYLHENRAHSYALLARQARDRGRPEAVQHAAQQGLMVLRAARTALEILPSRTTEVLCYAHESTLRLLSGDLAGAQLAADRAAELHSGLDQQLYIEVNLCLAELSEARGHHAAALDEYQVALGIVRSQHRHRDTQRILQAISAMHERAGQYPQALRAAREALVDAQDALRRMNVTTQRQAQQDASSWQDRLRQAETQARQDPLTGLLNRRGLEEGLLTLQTPDGGPVAALFVDIDHFKRVNDRHSHAGGDRALKGVADVLRTQLARWPGALLARYGGEEFVLIAPVSDATQAHALAEGCRRAVAAHAWSTLLPGTNLTASVGYAVEPAHRLPEALTLADEHLYRAKRAGRNRVYPPSD